MNRRRALTLAEVMVFVVLVSMAILALVAAQLYAMRTNTGGQERAQAGNLAYSTLNEVLHQQRQDFHIDCSRARTDLPEAPGYQVAVAQAYLPDGRENLKQIFCSVYWTDPTGPQEFRTFTMLYRSSP